MKKIGILIALLTITVTLAVAQKQCDDSRYGAIPAAKTDYVAYSGDFKGKSLGDISELVIYLDKGSKENNYVPSGWIGDYGDVTMDDGATDNSHSGSTCLKFVILTLIPVATVMGTPLPVPSMVVVSGFSPMRFRLLVMVTCSLYFPLATFTVAAVSTVFTAV